MNISWHTKTVPEILTELRSSKQGLQQKEAASRLEQYGPNQLPEARMDGSFTIFLRQFQSPLIYLLVAASVTVIAIKEFIDGAIILFVLLFNAIIGTIQEGKSQNTLLALKKFSKARATVLRNDKQHIIPEAEVVPGDILILQEGEKIPADARVILSQNLTVDEAALTGESLPVHKMDTEAASEKENTVMVYKATSVVAGHGQAIIVGTGIHTAIGAIAKTIAVINTEIPLKKRIRELSHVIIATVGVISAFVFILGISIGRPIKEMFTTVVSLAVSIVPEGLPVVVTLILVTGVWRMSKRNALIKKLQAVEALGQTRILAIDKTGTLTKNEMIVQKVYTDGELFSIGGIGYEAKGNIVFAEQTINSAEHPSLLLAGKIACLSANAHVLASKKGTGWHISGDPTEAALLILGQKLGFHKEALAITAPLIKELPFDYKLKYHALLHRIDGKNLLSVVGAPEVILDMSTTLWEKDASHPLDTKKRSALQDMFHHLSESGLRVVAVAIRPDASETLESKDLKNLSFLGFYGMKDATRPEAIPAIQQMGAAGVKVVMITGDHKITAQAIAREVGIWQKNDQILTGEEIENLSKTALAKALTHVSVFARVNPEHKMKIINAYRSRGETVAMTGDGVNDAPSLVAADLGVAMGNIGTEVAKEAADIILLDDNLQSIVSAIEEGRNIYQTIKKVILYLFSTSIGEVFTIVGTLIFGWPLPILAAQIIWLNLVTDGFLDVALAMEPKEQGILNGTFKTQKQFLVDEIMGQRMLLMSVVMGIGTLYLFQQYYQTDLAKAWTIALTALAVFQWFNAWNCRSERESIFRMNPLSNPFLIGATLIVIILQLLAVYTPLFQHILRTVPLNSEDWIKIIPVAATILVAEEIRKLIVRITKRAS